MIHIIYARDVMIRDIAMENALSDAIDIDISRVTIEGGVIERSGNDAIDLMSSDAVIRGIRLVGNGDKGVSVGEGSKARIVDVDITDNEIGVQSKDGSVARIATFGRNGRAFQRVQRDIDFRATGTDLLTDIQHRRFIALALTDNNGAVDLQSVERRTHGVHRSLIGSLLVSPTHQFRCGKRSSFSNPHHFKSEITIHLCSHDISLTDGGQLTTRPRL